MISISLSRWLLLLLSVFIVSCASGPAIDGSDDPHLWLEDVEGAKALEWVKGENRRTLGILTQTKDFQAMKSKALNVLQAKDKIPGVSIRGAYLYNFWQDGQHVRGLWRRTTLKSFETKKPRWETILDFDSLAKKDKENWVFKGSECLPPKYQRCLLRLSRGGKDAVVVKEFDIPSRKFVAGGFETPEAKSYISWKDQNHLFVATNFGKGTLTESGYPRVVKTWKRGTALDQAKTLYTGEVKDMLAAASTLRHDGESVGLVERRIGFYSGQSWLIVDNKLQKLNKPDSAEIVGLFKKYILVQLRDSWAVGSKTFPAGAVVGMKLAAAKNGKTNVGDIVNVFTPGKNTAILRLARTKNSLLVNVLQNVRGRIQFIGLEKGVFAPLMKPLKNHGHISLSSSDPDGTYFFYGQKGFLNPDSLSVFNLVTKKSKVLKSLPVKFNAKGMSVTQKWATSADGTKVPYFLVGKDSAIKSGKAPTLLYGYGGFEVSLTPSYSAINGQLWLEKGGVYALANIRGGGEFGPKWHQAALKKNRHKAYDDFIAVGEHLISSGVTKKDHLGIYGGSNGGLLVGSVMTRRPDLFKAVVCAVPLLDMLRYSQLLAGASWMAEYGDPRKSDMREYLASYSPYQNVKKDVKYPSLFLMTSTKDDRVHPGHARKMAARMKTVGHKDLFYYENIEGGHSASANLKQVAEKTALRFAFLNETL